jgi:hypothetical protein
LFVGFCGLQCLQPAQEPPLHDPHPLGPLLATSRLPPPSRLIAAKVEIVRRALGAAQRGQTIIASDWLIGRNASNRLSQLSQWYS